MNIKEIIDNARTSLVYMDAGICDDALKQYENDVRKINAALDQIESAMMTQIAELEAQITKTVTPKPIGKNALGFEMYQCGCDSTVWGVENYCPECGTKLKWEES